MGFFLLLFIFLSTLNETGFCQQPVCRRQFGLWVCHLSHGQREQDGAQLSGLPRETKPWQSYWQWFPGSLDQKTGLLLVARGWVFHMTIKMELVVCKDSLRCFMARGMCPDSVSPQQDLHFRTSDLLSLPELFLFFLNIWYFQSSPSRRHHMNSLSALPFPRKIAVKMFLTSLQGRFDPRVIWLCQGKWMSSNIKPSKDQRFKKTHLMTG